jgi:hypothetical protein
VLAAETALFGWYLGYALGALVVVIVVVVVSWIIRSASTIARQAREATDAIERAQPRTAPLWRVAETNRALTRLHDKLRTARTSLE